MHIVFIILKIIGFILAALLGILLLACILLLTVPIRYLVDIEKEKDWKGKIKFHWLLHLVTMTMEYKNDKTDIKIRFFGIHLFSGLGKNSIDKKADKKKKKAKNKDKKKKRNKRNNMGKDVKTPAMIMDDKCRSSENLQKQVIRETLSVGKSKESKRSLSKLLHLPTKIRNKCKRLKKTLSGTYSKIKDMKGLLFHRDSILGFKVVAKTAYEFLKHAKPTKLEGKIKIGFDDPSKTGMVLGVLSMAYVYFSGRLEIVPDFEQKVLEGCISASGRIRAFTTLKIFIRLLRDDGFKKLLNNFKQFQTN